MKILFILNVILYFLKLLFEGIRLAFEKFQFLVELFTNWLFINLLINLLIFVFCLHKLVTELVHDTQQSAHELFLLILLELLIQVG